MVKYLVNGMMIQLVTLFIQYWLFYTPGDDEVVTNGGAGIWFCLLTKYCFYNGSVEVKFCCFRWKFKRIVYPFVLFGVTVLLSFGIPLDVLVGLVYGLIQVGL